MPKRRAIVAKMIKVKLAQAIDKPQVDFLFGSKRITVFTQTTTEIVDTDFEALQKQFPGWIEQVTTKAAGTLTASPAAE